MCAKRLHLCRYAHIIKMQPFSDDIKSSHLTILHDQLTEVPPPCTPTHTHTSFIHNVSKLHPDVFLNYDFDAPTQIFKQSVSQSDVQSATVQPSASRSYQSSPSVPAPASASVPVQQSSPPTATVSNSVTSSPQTSAVAQSVQSASGGSPQFAAAAQQVVPQYSPVDGQDQYGR